MTCEVFKQCTNFATRYYAEDGKYPVPQTALVFGVEIIKLVSVGVVLVKTGEEKRRHNNIDIFQNLRIIILRGSVKTMRPVALAS